jgi:hypothetical protein
MNISTARPMPIIRLVVQQAVDCARVGFLVGLVHLPSVLDAPLGDGERVAHVADDTDEGDESVRCAEEGPENAAHERDFDERGHYVEQHERQQGVDAVRAALDGARQAAGLPFEMELQRQAVQVPEGLQSNRADGALRHFREDGIAQL